MYDAAAYVIDGAPSLASREGPIELEQGARGMSSDDNVLNPVPNCPGVYVVTFRRDEFGAASKALAKELAAREAAGKECEADE